MQFDIEDFYPSISKEILLKILTYAKTLLNISEEEINSIMHSRCPFYLVIHMSGNGKWRSRF